MKKLGPSTLVVLSYVFFSTFALPATADDIQFMVPTFEIRPTNSTTLSIGSRINLSKVDLAGKNVLMDGNVRFDVSKNELEAYLNNQAALIKPFDVQGGFLRVEKVRNISILPDKDSIAIGADFSTNLSPNYHRVMLKISNGLFAWAASQAVLKIVPHSLQIKFSDYTAMDAIERSAVAIGSFITRQGDVEFLSETTMQDKLDGYFDSVGIRKYMPQITEIKNIKFGTNKSNDRFWFASRILATFDKRVINGQLQSFVDNLGALGEGRSVAKQAPTIGSGQPDIAPTLPPKPAAWFQMKN